MENKRSPLGLIFLTVLIDMIGFGIVIPGSPDLCREPGLRRDPGATRLAAGNLLAASAHLRADFREALGPYRAQAGAHL
jgi:hypothetical protein